MLHGRLLLPTRRYGQPACVYDAPNPGVAAASLEWQASAYFCPAPNRGRRLAYHPAQNRRSHFINSDLLRKADARRLAAEHGEVHPVTHAGAGPDIQLQWPSSNATARRGGYFVRCFRYLFDCVRTPMGKCMLPCCPSFILEIIQTFLDNLSHHERQC
jgi:hypothetical protein